MENTLLESPDHTYVTNIIDPILALFMIVLFVWLFMKLYKNLNK